jgi:hypothetical protein
MGQLNKKSKMKEMKMKLLTKKRKSKKAILVIGIMGLGFVANTNYVNAKTKNAPVERETAKEEKVMEEVHVSEFTGTKNPFYPAGYKSLGKGKKPTGINFNVNSFSVSSISMGKPRYAIINGKIYGEKETIDLEGSKIVVAKINDGEVILAPEGMTGAKLSIILQRNNKGIKSVTPSASPAAKK